ncbi:MAG: sigma-70 family RNA polymerase sigma factor [Lentisphaeria bacterium]|nr:sigma-70 family RNA polymerase sigma factor [Lentisphaeria bacterium]
MKWPSNNQPVRHGYTTRPSHIERLRRQEEKAWCEFYEKYRDMIYAIGAKHHLSDEDCRDLMQSVIMVCCDRLKTFVYAPERCRFRTWLAQVARNVAFNIRRRNAKAQPPATEPPPVFELPEIDLVFLREYELFLLEHALDTLRQSVDSETYCAFELLVIQERSIPETVRITGKTPTALYSIKSRCMKRLREIITRLIQNPEIPPETDSPAGSGKTSRR